MKKDKTYPEILLEFADLKIITPKRERLVCGYCGKPPHWFGKFCCLKAELNFFND